MNSSRRYLPLSLALLVAASCAESANAGSSLDPYVHVKPPASAAQKQKKQAAAVPQADDMDQPTTFVKMMPIHDPEADKANQGLIGKTMAPFRKAGSHVAKGSRAIGDSIASGAKNSSGMAKKSATVIGTGFKSTGDKLKDSTDTVSSKIANKPKKESANRTASVDDWYSKETERAIAKNDNGDRARQLAKQDSTKTVGTQQAFLPQTGNGKKLNLNPFGKLALGKKKQTDDGLNLRPTSGFADAQMNPDEDVLAEIQKDKARIAEAKKKEKEIITPLNEKKRIESQQQVASTTAVSKPEVKKSKFGGLNMAKLKPGMPGLPSFKKDKKQAPAQHQNAVAAAPKKVDTKPALKPAAPAVAHEEPSGDLMAAGETSIPEHAQPSMAFNTGDREIDSAVAAGTARATTINTVAKAAPAEKKGGMMKLGMPKMNFLPKKKKAAPTQTATKADAPKQM